MAIGSLVLGLCLMLVFLIINGLFVAFEFGIIALRKSRVEEMVQRGQMGAERIQKMQKEMDKTIAGAQLGITLASLAIGWLGDHSILPLIKTGLSYIPWLADAQLPVGIGVAMSFVVLSMLHVIIGEQVPKTMALRMPERMTLLLAVPFRIFCFLTLPLVWIMDKITNLILLMMGLKKGTHHESPLPSPAEFQILFEESVKAGTMGKQESDLLKRALELKALTVREAMIPRTRIDFVEDGQSLSEVMAVVSRTKHSKLPVFRTSRDNVIGVLNTRDLFDLFQAHLRAQEVSLPVGAQAPAGAKAPAVSSAQDRKPFKLSEFIRRAYFVPETKLASTLLEELKERKLQMAIVLDEFGATVGLVTLEDLVEQLVGEIWDEHDDPHGGVEEEGDGVFTVPGELTLFEFNRHFDTDLSCDSHCVTIAGAVIEKMDHQPVVGESAELGGFRFTVLELAGHAVMRLEVRRLATEDKGEADHAHSPDGGSSAHGAERAHGDHSPHGPDSAHGDHSAHGDESSLAGSNGEKSEQNRRAGSHVPGDAGESDETSRR